MEAIFNLYTFIVFQEVFSNLYAANRSLKMDKTSWTHCTERSALMFRENRKNNFSSVDLFRLTGTDFIWKINCHCFFF